MEETLLVGDHVVVDKLAWAPPGPPVGPAPPAPGDPAAGTSSSSKGPEDPGRDFIKRAVGLRGGDGRGPAKRLLVNGVESGRALRRPPRPGAPDRKRRPRVPPRARRAVPRDPSGRHLLRPRRQPGRVEGLADAGGPSRGASSRGAPSSSTGRSARRRSRSSGRSAASCAGFSTARYTFSRGPAGTRTLPRRPLSPAGGREAGGRTCQVRNRMRGEGAFGTIVGIALVVLVGIALFKIVPLHIAGNKVLDAMSEQANFAGVKPLDKIQYEIFVAAQEAGTPLVLAGHQDPPVRAGRDRRGEVHAEGLGPRLQVRLRLRPVRSRSRSSERGPARPAPARRADRSAMRRRTPRASASTSSSTSPASSRRARRPRRRARGARST